MNKLFLLFGAVSCQVCTELILDRELIRDDSSKSFCWSRPEFQAWSDVNVERRNVSLSLITDREYYYQPNSGRYFAGQIFKPDSFLPLFVEHDGKKVKSTLVSSDIEFLVTWPNLGIVRMQTFEAERPVGQVACKLPQKAFKCNKWDQVGPAWRSQIHRCIPTKQSTFPIETVLAVNLVLKTKPGCTENPCYQVLSYDPKTKKNQKTIIKYSKLRNEWRHLCQRHVCENKRVVMARKRDDRDIPCPFDDDQNDWKIAQ